MSFTTNRTALLAVTALLATSACGGGAVPSGALSAGNPSTQVSGASVRPADSTSILNKLTKDVVIGSTVDPKNGDTGSYALSIAPVNYGLKKGQLLVCDFEDSSGTAGNGESVEVLDNKAGSTPKTFAQTADIKGCDGDAVTSGNQVYVTGYASNLLVGFNQKGKEGKKYPITAPFANGDAAPGGLYTPEYIFNADSAGDIISLSLGAYGTGKTLQVATGFATNGKSGWSGLGASGVTYNGKSDSLYIVDGVDNTLVEFTHASNLLEKNEIVVEKGGKTFKCLHKSTTCGKLIYAGSALNAPKAATILPNGNFIIANTGDNNLVEISAAGQVLATKAMDTGKSPGIFGLAAYGTSDSNTVLYFTDTNGNNVQELEP